MTLHARHGQPPDAASFATSGMLPGAGDHTYVQLFGPGLPDAGRSSGTCPAGRGHLGRLHARGHPPLPGRRRGRRPDRRHAGLFRNRAGLQRTPAWPSTAGSRLTCVSRRPRRTRPTRRSRTRSRPSRTRARPSRTRSRCPRARSGRSRTRARPDAAGRLADVPRDNLHAASIDCVVFWRVAAGRSAAEYAPTLNVNRGQMARFIATSSARAAGPCRRSRPVQGRQRQPVRGRHQRPRAGGCRRRSRRRQLRTERPGVPRPDGDVPRERLPVPHRQDARRSRDYYSDDAGNVTSRASTARPRPLHPVARRHGLQPRNLVRATPWARSSPACSTSSWPRTAPAGRA
jgi:hypothetical protein